MSLLEWISEPTNPGPVGKIEINKPEPDNGNEPPKKWLIYISAVIGLCLAVAGLYWFVNSLLHIGPTRTFLRLCIFSLYVVIAYFVRPAPDTTNVGWMGGIVDHPFRISDDFNRALLFTQIILLPGKLVAYCLTMSWFTGNYFYKMLKK